MVGMVASWLRDHGFDPCYVFSLERCTLKSLAYILWYEIELGERKMTKEVLVGQICEVQNSVSVFKNVSGRFPS